MRILITGATGFVGKWLLKHIQTNNSIEFSELTLFIRDKSKLDKINIDHQIIEGDIKNKELLASCVRKVDMIIHIAAEVRVGLKWQIYEETNLIPTQTIVDNLTKNHKIIYISSTAVYGIVNEKNSIDESFSTANPFDNYGLSKIKAENYIREHSTEGYKYIILRPSAISGPGDLKLTIPYLDAIKNKKLVFINGSNNIIPMIHPWDLAEAISLSINNIDNLNHETFHLTGFQDPIKDVINSYCDIFGYPLIDKSIPYIIAATFTFFKDIVSNSVDKLTEKQNLKLFTANLLLNCDKISNSLGYKPKYDRINTIKDIGKWYKSL